VNVISGDAQTDRYGKCKATLGQLATRKAHDWLVIRTLQIVLIGMFGLQCGVGLNCLRCRLYSRSILWSLNCVLKKITYPR